jgi:hypothetical protein
MSEVTAGLTQFQEPKYTVNAHGKLMNRKTGIAIPDDEPVFIMRAKDSLALKMLTAYRHSLEKGEHRDAVDARIKQFEEYMATHAQNVRMPD